jgi:hypothetical protein
LMAVLVGENAHPELKKESQAAVHEETKHRELHHNSIETRRGVTFELSHRVLE